MEVPVELKRKYLDRRYKELQNLKNALNNDDFTGALKLGHQVKGTAVTFEFPQMAQYGIDLEMAASLHDKEKVSSLASRMEVLILNAKDLLRVHL